ncbi:MAG: hypothetical protein IIC11_11365 [Proteobacteria bacterium]|nr:hypothetical protein [Pseudomonadota bacterium]
MENKIEALDIVRTLTAGSIASDSSFSMGGVALQAQQATIVDADGTLADITTKFNTLLADLEGFGFLASV